MPKTPSNKLFNLIKSLTGSEKRYFKLFANNNTGKTSKYIQLFDAIDAQNSYDDEALKQLVYQGEKIQSRKYSELKAYLYELILKCLQNYDEKISINYKLKGMLQSIRVLYKRSHYNDCTELLLKAKKMATKYEVFSNIIELLQWEKKIAYAKGGTVYLSEGLERIEKEEQNCLAKISNQTAYRNIFYRILMSIRQNALLRNEDQVMNLNKIIAHPLLTDFSQAITHDSQIMYHRIYGLYYYSTLQYEAFYESTATMIDIMEQKPHFLDEDVSDYISALSNFMVSCGLLERYEELELSLDKLYSIKPKTAEDERIIHVEYFMKKFSLCIFTGNFEEGQRALVQHQKELKKFDQQFFETSRFYSQYFYLYFGVGDYDQALDYLNKWLNLPRSAERQDLQSLARILNLIIHFEMRNTMLLDYLLRSTYRFLSKRNRIHQFERRVMNFIRESNQIQNQKELHKAFEVLKKDFEKLAEIPEEKVMFQYFDFIAWLESKIKNKPFATIMSERYKGRKRN